MVATGRNDLSLQATSAADEVEKKSLTSKLSAMISPNSSCKYSELSEEGSSKDMTSYVSTMVLPDLLPSPELTGDPHAIEKKVGNFELLAPPLAAALVASVAYVDPGNFATNIQAGSQFGYTLLWVVLLANVMAMVFQLLSAKLGIATRMNLARCCREYTHPYVNWALWIIAEIAALATDVAEFVGAAVGLKILFHIPLIWGGFITAGTTWLLLLIHERGVRYFECIVIVFVSIIAICYVIETGLDDPDWGQVGYHLFVPQLQGTDSILLAVGIIGATVMPHAIYLHSALVQDRKTVEGISFSRSFGFEMFAVVTALGIAGCVNLAVIIMSAATFYRTGLVDIATLEDAFETLVPILGPSASYVFAVGLIASGISSSAVGTLAGQVIMEGFLEYKVSLWIRRFLTVLPSLCVIVSGVDPTQALVVSQVVLSFCIPFALVPLVYFTSRQQLMGEWKNYRATTVTAWLFASVIICLNLYLVYSAIAS